MNKKLEKCIIELEQLKVGLCFGAWDMGLPEPVDKDSYYRKTLTKVIEKLVEISDSWEVKQ